MKLTFSPEKSLSAANWRRGSAFERSALSSAAMVSISDFWESNDDFLAGFLSSTSTVVPVYVPVLPEYVSESAMVESDPA